MIVAEHAILVMLWGACMRQLCIANLPLVLKQSAHVGAGHHSGTHFNGAGGARLCYSHSSV